MLVVINSIIVYGNIDFSEALHKNIQNVLKFLFFVVKIKLFEAFLKTSERNFCRRILVQKYLINL